MFDFYGGTLKRQRVTRGQFTLVDDAVTAPSPLSTVGSSRKLIPFGNRVSSVGSSSSISTKQRTKKTFRKIPLEDTASNETDISVHLMEAVTGGTGRRNKVLRDVFRKAVEHQYNSTKALARLNAVYSGNYRIEENSNVRVLGSGAVKQIDVHFHRGAGCRTFHEETVDLLPDETLIALFKLALDDNEGMGREVLKPMNLSKCSPRMFWSLVYSHGSNVVHTIKSMLQGIDDCEWLTERKKELSDKAKENERQLRIKHEEQLNRKEKSRKKRNLSAAESASDEVEDQSPNANGIAAAVDTKEVLLLSLQKSIATMAFDSEDLAWIQSLSFVNVVPQDQCKLLNGALESDSMLNLALCPPQQLYSVVNAIDEQVMLEQVETWIESAQFSLLQYIWYEICGHGCERIRLTLKRLRIRCPKEILVWKKSSGDLLRGMFKLDAKLSMIPCKWVSGVVSVVTEDLISWMIKVCSAVVASLTFTHKYSDLIDDDDDNDDGGEMIDGIEDDWKTDIVAHSFIGKRCRIPVRDMFSLPVDEKVPCDGIFFWEDGTIFGYLPPTDEEPMALWRVRLDVKGDENSMPRFEDLEEHEVRIAMERLEDCNEIQNS